jgi:hypothetical protein
MFFICDLHQTNKKCEYQKLMFWYQLRPTFLWFSCRLKYNTIFDRKLTRCIKKSEFFETFFFPTGTSFPFPLHHITEIHHSVYCLHHTTHKRKINCPAKGKFLVGKPAAQPRHRKLSYGAKNLPLHYQVSGYHNHKRVSGSQKTTATAQSRS